MRLFKMWGVFEVEIEADDTVTLEPTPEIDPDLVRNVSQAVASQFVKLDLDHPAVKEILRLSIEYRLKHGIISDPSTERQKPQQTAP